MAQTFEVAQEKQENARTSGGECTNSHARSQHCELEHSRAFLLLFRALLGFIKL
jgi:hypothetical protein